MNKKMMLLFVSLLMCSGVNANATFIGNVMEAHVYVPPSKFYGPGGTFFSSTFDVNDSVELPLFGVFNECSIDVTENNILIDFWRPGRTDFHSGYYVFQDINSTISGITDVNVNPSTDGFLTSWGAPIPFDPSRITFDEDNIFVNLSGMGVDANTLLSLDVSFAAVPEPTTLWLFGYGFLALVGFSRHFSRRRQPYLSGRNIP